MAQMPALSGPSPLAEAQPESLDELFSRDPLKLQAADLDTIITNLRAQRARLRQVEEQTGKVPRGKAAVSGPKAPKVAYDPNMKLDDLI